MTPNQLLRTLVVALLPALAPSHSLEAQEEHAKFHHYKLLDLGTFGGPTSAISALVVPLNSRGLATSCADTSVQDPDYPSINAIWFNDRFIQHAFLWEGEHLHDLSALPGGTSSCGQFINRRGQISGYSTNGETDTLLGTPAVHAVLWNHGQISDLGTLGGFESAGYGLNEQGVVVGGASNKISDPYTTNFFNFFVQAATQVHAFLWKDGMLQDLRTLGTGTDSVAFYVNDKGQVAGQSFTDTTVNPSTGLPTMHPFLWENGTMRDLGTIGGTLVTQIAALNGKGQVAGGMNVAGDASSHAFLWNGLSINDLGTLGGTDSNANGLNDAGEVVGLANTQGDQNFHAFLWRDGVMSDLKTLGGDANSLAEAVSASGQIVGSSFDSQGNVRVFLWEHNGPMVDLQNLIVRGPNLSLIEAVFINDRGEIAADGLTSNGDQHGVLLIPCDENHAEVEGCDYSLLDATTAAQVRAPQAAQSSIVGNDNHARPMGLRDRMDGRLIYLRGFSGVRSPNK
jgi:probable HAF family extracellular repeat protein